LKTTDELKNTRTQNAETLDKLQKALPGDTPQ
jgi:hypothetical protein